MHSIANLEEEITRLLAEEEYNEHPLRAPLAALFQDYQDHLAQMERLTTISDGYQTVLREKNHTLADRFRKQIKYLQKIVRISDQYQQMLREANDALKIASTQDPLTGLPNRRLMEERLTAEVALAARHGHPVAIAMIDIDHFKRINDSFGHDVGDKTLVTIAKAISNALRAYDVCARWGGEEFLILLPETEVTDALAIAERLRASVEQCRFSELPPHSPLTISIGLAMHGKEANLDDTIKRSDAALYEAKNMGRNRVILSA